MLNNQHLQPGHDTISTASRFPNQITPAATQNLREKGQKEKKEKEKEKRNAMSHAFL
jgi:hypothetical protein